MAFGLELDEQHRAARARQQHAQVGRAERLPLELAQTVVPRVAQPIAGAVPVVVNLLHWEAPPAEYKTRGRRGDSQTHTH